MTTITNITATMDDGSTVVLFPVAEVTAPVTVEPTHIEVTDGEVIEIDVAPEATA